MPDTPSPDPAGRGPSNQGGSIESRLRAAREARGLSLTDVQQETRIPADVLQRLEDGRLLGDASFNPVYLKALLKAYAGAVGLPVDEVLSGFDPGTDRLVAAPPHAVVAGTTPATPVEPIPEPPAPARRPDARRVDVTPRVDPPATVPSAAETTPPKAPKRERPAPEEAPHAVEKVSEVAAAPPSPMPPASSPVAAVGRPRGGAAAGAPGQGKHRVISAEAARTPRAFDRSWGLIIGGTLGLVGLFALALFLLFRDRTPQPEPRPAPVAADTVATPDTTATQVAEPPVQPAGPTLASPIRISVTAGAGGLQNFRVTEEPNERLGHWIEEGQTVTFESPTAIVLWGEGAEGLGGDAALELQGLRWTPSDNRVLRVDTQNGQRLLDSLSGAGRSVQGADG